MSDKIVNTSTDQSDPDLLFVDDAAQREYIMKVNEGGRRAMDEVLEDVSYGDANMNKDEEKMERNDTDSGWGFSSLKKVGRGLRRGARGISSRARRGLRGVGRLAKKPLGFAAKRFLPNRDAQKARLVKSTYNKLWFEHANWLAKQDQAAGRPLQPRSQYEATAKDWARTKLAEQRLPLKYAVGAAEIMGAEIMGADVMGVWWNPFSWFQNQVNVVVNSTAAERDPNAPDEQAADAQSQAPADMDPGAVSAPEEYDDQSGWNGIRALKGHDVLGEDSLGAFVGHVLNREQPARDNPSADAVVAKIETKLRSGQPIDAGELGLLSSAAKEGSSRAQKILRVLQERGAVVSGDETGLDPWLHKLNPAYWLRSSKSRAMKDREVKEWKENADLQKKLKKQGEDVDAATRAKTAAEAVAAAKAQAASNEEQLRAIEAALKSSSAGSFVGHEKITPISKVVLDALARTGKRDSASKIYTKIQSGEKLSPSELSEASKIAALVGRLKVVHGDILSGHAGTEEFHNAITGACVLGNTAEAIAQSMKHQKAADSLSRKLASGKPLSTEERVFLSQVVQGTKKIRDLTKAVVSGVAFVGCSQGPAWHRAAVVGVARTMSPQDRQMLSAITKLAKVGNPRAQRVLTALKKSGEVVGGDFVGLSLSKAFKYATAPVWLPAKGLYKGAKWTGQKLGIVSKGKSAEQVRLDRMRAAYKRKQAAEARARAADAQNEAEQRAQQAVADAADAEADAADAKAAAEEAAMKTKEYEANPDMIPAEGAEDTSGAFVGSWCEYVGKETKGGKALAVAQSKTPAGTKVRSAAAVYARAKQGDPKAMRAIKVMVQKANRGDQQALRDLDAMKVSSLAVRAKISARRAEAEAKAKHARQARAIAFQRKLEAKAANKLAQASRRRELTKLAKVEKRAAAGSPKHRAYVAKQVSAAKRGDRKAQARVEGMKLARTVRLSTKTRRDKRNLRQAAKLVTRARRGDPKAVRQVAVIKDAARAGNPNAKRAMKKLVLADAVVLTVATGVVTQAGKKSKKGKPAAGSAAYVTKLKQVESAKQKAAAKSASREELVAGARVAQEIGDRTSAAELARAATQAPSATEAIKNAATKLAAAKQGSPEAAKELQDTLASAKGGDPTAVKQMGNLAAAQTAAAIERGEPVPQPMKDAISLQERARGGDPTARTTLKNVSEAAASPDATPEAVAAATYAAGAATLTAALASKPKAKQELMDKIHPPVPEAERGSAEAQVAECLAKANDGTITPEEGAAGVLLAQRLGKAKVAAEIAAKSPPLDYVDPTPLSSLPDQPLEPVCGPVGVIKAALRALTFSTRDPLANYREGVASRGSGAATVAPVIPASSSGWSPFAIFSAIKKVAPYTSPVAAAASVASLARGGGKRGAPAPTPVAAAPAPTPTPAAPAAKEASKEAEETVTAGEEPTAKEMFFEALKSKKMSRSDFNKAVDLQVGREASPDKKRAVAQNMLKFLQKRDVKVG